jgi:hypothetical protein
MDIVDLLLVFLLNVEGALVVPAKLAAIKSIYGSRYACVACGVDYWDGEVLVI